MFKCQFFVHLPLVFKENKAPYSIRVSEFNFDPGLNINDQVTLRDVSLVESTDVITGKRNRSPGYSFKALVTQRNYAIEQRSDNNEVEDTFILEIKLEIADKEIMLRMVEQILSIYPDVFEKYSPELNN